MPLIRKINQKGKLDTQITNNIVTASVIIIMSELELQLA